ncbi:MAG: hypothetical protein ACFFFG_03415 [Candidatus Thorarchaeota archaeon]
MSYVEKAFWDYLKSTIFGGIRILLSRRLILFSIVLFITSLITTGVIMFQDQDSTILTPEVLEFIVSFQISIVIGFLLAGLFSKKLSTSIRFALLIVVVIIAQALFFLTEQMNELQPISNAFLQFIPLITFFSWTLLIPLASFAFAKGLFANKITGSILFLGKPSSDRKSIFSGIMTLIAVLSIFWNVIMLGIGIDQARLSYIGLGIIGLGLAVLVILVVQGFITGDDVFNTSLGFFFLVSLPNQIMIFLTSVSGSENIVTSFDYFMVIFSLVYSAQNISRRIKMKGSETTDPKTEDPFRIGRFIGFVGGEGVVLIYLGLALGFQLVQLQVLSGMATAWTDLFGGLASFSEIYHDLTMASMVFILLIVILIYKIQRGKGYWEVDIYRFDFLPPYEDLVSYMEKIKSGEISKTDIAVSVGRKAVEGIGVLSAARKFRDTVFGRKKDSGR